MSYGTEQIIAAGRFLTAYSHASEQELEPFRNQFLGTVWIYLVQIVLGQGDHKPSRDDHHDWEQRRRATHRRPRAPGNYGLAILAQAVMIDEWQTLHPHNEPPFDSEASLYANARAIVVCHDKWLGSGGVTTYGGVNVEDFTTILAQHGGAWNIYRLHSYTEKTEEYANEARKWADDIVGQHAKIANLLSDNPSSPDLQEIEKNALTIMSQAATRANLAQQAAEAAASSARAAEADEKRKVAETYAKQIKTAYSESCDLYRAALGVPRIGSPIIPLLPRPETDKDREARQAREAAENAEREAREAREAADRIAHAAAQRNATERAERAEQEARKATERAERAEQEAREAAERTEREASERTERETREAAEREAAERVEREASERVEREASERAERAEQEARKATERAERAEREARDAREAAERADRERVERELAEREAAEREWQEAAFRPTEGITQADLDNLTDMLDRLGVEFPTTTDSHILINLPLRILLETKAVVNVLKPSI